MDAPAPAPTCTSELWRRTRGPGELAAAARAVGAGRAWALGAPAAPRTRPQTTFARSVIAEDLVPRRQRGRTA